MIFVLCSHCKQRPATRLCDAPVGRHRYIGHPPRYLMQKAHSLGTMWMKLDMETTLTCDRQICNQCATKIATEIDYCPKCLERIKTAIKKR